MCFNAKTTQSEGKNDYDVAQCMLALDFKHFSAVIPCYLVLC